MDKQEIANYKKAGEIASEMQSLAAKTLKAGTSLFTFAEKIEGEIKKSGGGLAFPINLSRNNEAAHYTPEFDSKEVAGENDVIKVDIGVHVNGYIADSARTIDLSGKYTKMVSASADALEMAVKIAIEGTEICEIGETIEQALKSRGFNPVRNLSGHGVGRFDAHTAPTIPNVGGNDRNKLEDGMAFAIEPFATDGRGHVKEGSQAEIFQLTERKGIRDPSARKILDYVEENCGKLPFAERWIERDLKLSGFSRKIAMRELMQKGCIMAYPILREDEGKIVTQAETTILLSEGKAIRLL